MDLLDKIANEENFKDVAKELLQGGQSVIGRNPIISAEYNYMIEPDLKAYLIRSQDMEIVKIRELSDIEYLCIGISQYE